MTKLAAEEWKRVVALLSDMGAPPTALHQSTLEIYCESMATVRRCNKEIETKGEVLVNPMGGWVRNPASVSKLQANKDAIRCSIELGLTPGSAGKIPKPKETKKSKFDDL